MKWALPVGRPFGIRLEIHATFLLILLYIGWKGWTVGGASTAMWAVLLVALLFVCVVLHELGHSVMAMRFGVQVRYIVLFPIGGVAAMSEIPEKPIREFLIAVAGPLVNVVIVLLLRPVTGSFFPDPGLQAFPSDIPSLFEKLQLANAVLVIFNLVPAFPMDGGRILRSLLAIPLSYEWATQIAVWVGQAVAIGFVVLGLRWNPFLVLIGGFVFFGAVSENRMVRTRARFRGIRAADIMSGPGAVLGPEQPLGDCMRLLADRRQSDFLVLSEGRLTGILERDRWMRAIEARGAEAPVSSAMRRSFVCFRPLTEMSAAWKDMLSMEQKLFPVVEGEDVMGRVTQEDMIRFLSRSRGPERLVQDRSGTASSSASDGRWSIDLG